MQNLLHVQNLDYKKEPHEMQLLFDLNWTKA